MSGLPPLVEKPWPLIGRDRLVDRLDEAIATNVRTIAIYGGAGVGKSRVAAELAGRRESAGWTVLRVWATTIMSSVPLGALAPVIGGTISQQDAAAGGPALLSALRDELDRRAPGRERLVVVDSLALLDPLSTTLLAQLMITGAIRLVATLRDGDPLPDPLLETWSADFALRVDVPPLTLDETERALTTVLGAPVAHRAAAELWRQTGGVPFVLREVVLGALAAGGLEQRAEVWQLTGVAVATPALRELILARVRGLEPHERDALERLALCGELPVTQLAEPGARDALARFETAGLVEVAQGRNGLTVRLVDRQFQATIAETLSRLRRAEVLMQQAALAEAPDSTPADRLRATVWRLEAGSPGDPEVLADSARLARTAGDYRTVERLTAAALAAAGERPDLLLLRGEALVRLGRVDDALEVLLAAGEHNTEPTLDAPIAAMTAMAYASRHDGLEAGLAVLDRAAASGDLGVTLMRSLVTQYTNRQRDAEAIVRAACEWLGDSKLECATIASALAQPLAAMGREAEAAAEAELALEFARATDGVVPGHSIANALVTLATVQLHGGRPQEARVNATAALTESIAADDQIVARTIEFLLGRIALESGRLDVAERWFGDAASGALTAGPISLHVPSVATISIIKALRGDVAGARAALDALAPERNLGPGGVIANAWIAALSGDLATAQDSLLERASHFRELGDVFLAANMLHALVRMGGSDAAAPTLVAMAAAAPGVLLERIAAHATAEAAGDRAALARVGEDWADSGHLLYAAEAFASAARAARRAEDQRKAIALQSRADELAARCEGAATPLLQFTDELVPLTRREREIAVLAGQGIPSREIAQRLFLSTRTVDNHLQAVYGKLGIRSRQELASSLG